MRQSEPCAAEAAPRPPALLGQVHDELEPRSLRDEDAAPVAVHRLLGRLQPGRGLGRARGEAGQGTCIRGRSSSLLLLFKDVPKASTLGGLTTRFGFSGVL